LALGEFGQNIRFYKVKDSIQWLSAIAHNGPAIWGGCVGALKRHGALFAVRIQIFMSITRVAVQVITNLSWEQDRKQKP
jgi:hypothetical protein